ncbi:MAG: TIGR03960 family B12-binding radical SAM protein, partial [Spirochaetota bacterium]|nr:TIGR03960 family B12-binding radical SAM protein [Spirochaetota bacterium]
MKSLAVNKNYLEKLLFTVSKPTRYIGEEINQVRKDFDNTEFKIALSYPDLYELGMSNLGIKILYELINAHDKMLCERVFMPWFDMIDKLKEHNMDLFSLESRIPLRFFDMIGFSLQYELTYTNILGILDLAKIPLYSKDRSNDFPIIIAGGPCTYNPEPLADFIDFFVIGESENAVIEIGKRFVEYKKAGLKKKEMLMEFSSLTGIYVPSNRNAIYVSDRDLNKEGIKNNKIKRLISNDLNNIKAPIKPPVPYLQVIQDYGAVEVTRGCTVGCRFCQAGMIYRPVRERNINNIINYCEALIKNTGYHEVSLLSLSVADYTNLPSLIDALNSRFNDIGISFSLPSLRIDNFTLDVAVKVKEIRKSGLTFAIESGSEYIRNIINKSVSENKLLEIVKRISELGWKKIKLYFMIGFPISNNDYNDSNGKKLSNLSEEEEIISLINKLLSVNKKLQLNVSIGTFIPKPHTPFQ